MVAWQVSASQVGNTVMFETALRFCFPNNKNALYFGISKEQIALQFSVITTKLQWICVSKKILN